MPKILISYRRSDSEPITGRIFDRLASHYGRPSVFRDVDSGRLGINFLDNVKKVLDESDIVLVVVGSGWMGRRGGQRRIDDPVDTVRIEVETALRRGIPVIPLLVGRTRMPKVEQLPESLKDFAYRNGQRIDTGQDFDHHVDRLIREMDEMLAGARPLPAAEQPPSPKGFKTLPSNQTIATSDTKPAPFSGAVRRGPEGRPLAKQLSVGERWQRDVTPSALAEWKVPSNRADPVEILIEQGKNLMAELLPVRFARMRTGPFAFLRGAAAIMAADLGSGRSTGMRVQVCGDCHLSNFGAWSTPEGTKVFDVLDFDETLPAPFEWDLKRLTASAVVGGREARMSERQCRRLARAAALSYREHLAHLSRLPPLAAANSQIDVASAIAEIDSPKCLNLNRNSCIMLSKVTEHRSS